MGVTKTAIDKPTKRKYLVIENTMDKIVYRNYESKDFSECLELISDTFSKYCIETFVDEASLKNYSQIMSPTNERIIRSFETFPYQIVAIFESKIVWVLRGTNQKLLHLFVKEWFHWNWIASNLMKIYENRLKESWVKYIKLNASMNAISYYQKIWYKKTTGIRHKKWRKLQPMKKILF